MVIESKHITKPTFKEFVIPCKNPSNCLGDLLFIHGYCVEHTYFVAASNLSQYFNIYMLDLPGHGNNANGYLPKDLTFPKFTEHVIAYIEYKKLNNFFLVGHSMGGGIASCVASKIPSKIKKLILISPYNMSVFFIFKKVGLKAFTIFLPKNMKQKYRLLNILYKDYTKYLDNKE
jgi:triacylglycerol lipase